MAEAAALALAALVSTMLQIEEVSYLTDSQLLVAISMVLISTIHLIGMSSLSLKGSYFQWPIDESRCSKFKEI
jgi:hypothetical protein